MRLCRAAFTLVERLTVVAIVGVLVALLLPFVQSARESARCVACGNNVRQLALGCLQHLYQQHVFPSGGWDLCWIGDPDRGFMMAMADGSTHTIGYDVDATVHRFRGSRNDRQPTAAP